MLLKRHIWALGVTTFLVIGSPAHATGGLRCGGVVVKSTTLRADLNDCPGDGLVIGADNLTLDLGGHTLDGTGTAGTAGVRLAGHRGVTVKRGTLQEFGFGVLLDDADSNALLRLTATRSVTRGVQLQNGSDGNRLEHDVSYANGRSGFVLIASDRNVISHATGYDHPFSGIQGFGASHNRVVASTVYANAAGIGLDDGSNGNFVSGNVVRTSSFAGIAILAGNDNLITGNRLAFNVGGVALEGDRNRIVANVVTDAVNCEDGTCGRAIDLSGGTGNVITANRVARTDGDGILLAEYEAAGAPPVIGNVVRGNVVRDTGFDGIAVQNFTGGVSGFGTIKDNRVEGNLVIGAARDGIDVGRPANTVAGNVTLRNGALGIDAVVGVIDGGANRAFGNGDPRQCLVVVCR